MEYHDQTDNIDVQYSFRYTKKRTLKDHLVPLLKFLFLDIKIEIVTRTKGQKNGSSFQTKVPPSFVIGCEILHSRSSHSLSQDVYRNRGVVTHVFTQYFYLPIYRKPQKDNELPKNPN